MKTVRARDIFPEELSTMVSLAATAEVECKACATRQIIARLGKSFFANPEAAMAELNGIRSAAIASGQTATGFYIRADVTIYRVGSDYLTVARDGKVLSFVRNAIPGERVAFAPLTL